MLLAIPAAAASGAAQPAPTPVVEAARQVTTEANPTRNFVNPAIAVDPKHPGMVAVGAAVAAVGVVGSVLLLGSRAKVGEEARVRRRPHGFRSRMGSGTMVSEGE